MNPEMFDPKKELAWYCDSTKAHQGEAEREQRKKWEVKVAGIRKKKAAQQIVNQFTTSFTEWRGIK